MSLISKHLFFFFLMNPQPVFTFAQRCKFTHPFVRTPLFLFKSLTCVLEKGPRPDILKAPRQTSFRESSTADWKPLAQHPSDVTTADSINPHIQKTSRPDCVWIMIHMLRETETLQELHVLNIILIQEHWVYNKQSPHITGLGISHLQETGPLWISGQTIQ